jgi:hypothetical protein
VTTLMPTDHGTLRMAQRGIAIKDAELITLLGTEVSDGYLALDRDCQEAERELKKLIGRIRRLSGKRLVTAAGRIVTAYHASRRHERRLLRDAHECDLRDQRT